MILLHPNWKGPRVPIPHVKLDERQVKERSIFNQLKLLTLLNNVNASTQILVDEHLHYNKMLENYFL